MKITGKLINIQNHNLIEFSYFVDKQTTIEITPPRVEIAILWVQTQLTDLDVSFNDCERLVVGVITKLSEEPQKETEKPKPEVPAKLFIPERIKSLPVLALNEEVDTAFFELMDIMIKEHNKLRDCVQYLMEKAGE